MFNGIKSEHFTLQHLFDLDVYFASGMSNKIKF